MGNPSAPFDLGVPAIPEAEPFELEIPDVYTAKYRASSPASKAAKLRKRLDVEPVISVRKGEVTLEVLQQLSSGPEVAYIRDRQTGQLYLVSGGDNPDRIDEDPAGLSSKLLPLLGGRDLITLIAVENECLVTRFVFHRAQDDRELRETAEFWKPSWVK